MENRTPLMTWIRNFKLGLFDNSDRMTQFDAGWYYWFCRDTSLSNKTKKMGQIIKQFKVEGKVNSDKTYVWFKNNCPINHPLYDDFRIANINDNATQLIVQLDSPWESKKYTVYSVDDFFDKPVFETDSSRTLVKWLNNEI
jgi:hypothetical protein